MLDNQILTVKSLKEWAESIPDELNEKQIVLDGHGSYVTGYDPITILQCEPIDVLDNFPDDESQAGTKSVVVVRII